MSALLDFVAPWMPFVSMLFAALEIAAIILASVWRHRGEKMLRAYDYDRGRRYLDEAPKFTTMAVFIAILPLTNGGVPLLVGALTGTFPVPANIVESVHRVSVGLAVVTILAVVGLLAEMKFHRFMANADMDSPDGKPTWSKASP